MEYLEVQALESAPWEHEVLYDVFALHDRAYSPEASAKERCAYYAELTGRVFERLRIRAPGTAVAEHAEAVWRILGPASLGVFPDVVETLELLRARALPLAVVSNWQSGLRHFCAELGLGGFIDHVLCSGDLGVEKPDPRIFLDACQRLGVPPERTLHVGDTYVDDYLGASSAGLQVALIDRAGAPGAPGPELGDACVIRSLTELSALFGEG